MNFVHYINDELSECEIRMYLRDSCDLFRKSIDIYKSAKRVYMKRSVFSEYGYDEDWLQIMRKLWQHWQVESIQQFEKKMEELTSLDRVKMIEEIITADITEILLSKRR